MPRTGTDRLGADRLADGAYDAVDGPWDEVVELATEPELVGPALGRLARTAAHWTLVSSISVYARHDRPDADESASLVEPTDPTAYAHAKVLAERASTAALGDRLLVARAGLIVGAGDQSDRFGYWPARLDRPGPVLVPETGDRPVQTIDVEDLATWLGVVGRTAATGVVDAVGPQSTMADLLARTAAVTGRVPDLVPVPDDVLLAHGVGHWAGPRSLPLWLPRSDLALMQRSGQAFRETGGTVRPVELTIAGVLADERRRGTARPRRAGMTARAEADVLRRIELGLGPSTAPDAH